MPQEPLQVDAEPVSSAQRAVVTRTRPGGARHRGAHAYRAQPPAERNRPVPTQSPALVRLDTLPVASMAILSTAALAAFDLALTGRLSMFFDLCFILIGLTAALVVHRSGLFAVAVLPPLLLGSLVAVLAALLPSALTATPLAFVSTWLTGLAHHGGALVAAHTAVLAVVGLRAGQRAHPSSSAAARPH